MLKRKQHLFKRKQLDNTTKRKKGIEFHATYYILSIPKYIDVLLVFFCANVYLLTFHDFFPLVFLKIARFLGNNF